jgi:hypothetical protein
MSTRYTLGFNTWNLNFSSYFQTISRLLHFVTTRRILEDIEHLQADTCAHTMHINVVLNDSRLLSQVPLITSRRMIILITSTLVQVKTRVQSPNILRIASRKITSFTPLTIHHITTPVGMMLYHHTGQAGWFGTALTSLTIKWCL